MKILIDLINCKGDIRSSQSQILKTTNNASVMSNILRTKRRAICQC
jgi:hypothetical protein